MAKSRKTIDGQTNLFDLLSRLQSTIPEGTGSLNVHHHLKGIISDCIKHCRLSRWEIAGRMSAALNQEISKYQLDSWTAESKEQHRFPAEYLPAFCRAVDSHEALRFLAEKAGVFVLPGPEALRAEIKRIEEEIGKLQKLRKKRVVFLEEMDGGREEKELDSGFRRNDGEMENR